MALTSGQVCTQIITKGISCLPACSGLITSQFSLAGCRVRVTTTQVGGGIPLAPGEFAKRHKPVKPLKGYEDHPIFNTPQHTDPFNPKQHVTVTIEFRGETHEKEYLVNANRAKLIVNIVNFIHVVEQRYDIVVDKLNHIRKRLVSITNLRRDDGSADK